MLLSRAFSGCRLLRNCDCVCVTKLMAESSGSSRSPAEGQQVVRDVRQPRSDSVTNCYRCNTTGKCRSCACVMAHRRCYSCHPGRLGHCVNLSMNAADSPADTDSPTAAIAPTPGRLIRPTSPLANLSPTLTSSTTPSSPILSTTPAPLLEHCSLPVFSYKSHARSLKQRNMQV